jgi:integrase
MSRDYLFRKNNSSNWSVRFQRDGKDTIKSLGTSHRQEAEIIAGPLITHHKAALLALKPRFEVAWRFEFEPSEDMQAAPNGERVLASKTELKFFGPDGRLLRTSPNGRPAVHFVNGARQLGIPVPLGEPMFSFTEEGKSQARPKPDESDAILETYLKHANVTGFYEREARTAWALYKQLTNNKPLKNATRDDGRKLVEYFAAKGNKSASIRKKIGWLNAAVNLAIDEGNLKFNPFSKIVPKRDDGQRRLPFEDTDIRNVKRSLGQLNKSDQLLIRLLGATGMRLAEAFEIDSELKERGVRYCVVGSKTEQSTRRVPLPTDVLPYLPKKIQGPLFEGGPRPASKRLNRFLKDIGIADRRKVIHSFRHRAQDRLRAVGCPQDIRWALLGHEKRTIAEGYGEGFPVTLLKKWIDKIGF